MQINAAKKRLYVKAGHKRFGIKILKFLDVLAMEKSWSKHGKPAVTIFRTLAKPYIVPDFTPEGRKSLSRSLEINFFGPQIFQNICFSIFRIDKPT